MSNIPLGSASLPVRIQGTQTVLDDSGLLVKPGEAEAAYYATQAALMDPKAYEMRVCSQTPADIDVVPAGECWYLLNGWWLNCSSGFKDGSHGKFMRNMTVREAVPLPAGTVIDRTPNTGLGYSYLCIPRKVFATDARYTDDPKSLYYSRLQRLTTLPQFDILATDAATMVPFPADFTFGLMIAASVHEAQWMILGGGQPGWNITPFQELADSAHSVRFTLGNMLVPFDRTVFPKVGIGNAGTPDPPCAVLTYVKLPGDW